MIGIQVFRIQMVTVNFTKYCKHFSVMNGQFRKNKYTNTS